MSKIVNGKKPISERLKGSLASLSSIFGNTLAVDEKLTQEMKAKGLELRFINAAKLKEMGGYHKRGWEVYKPSIHGGSESINDFKFGQDPDGIIRRGDAVLAVRAIDLSDQHREVLKNKADRLKGSYNKESAEQLRAFSKEVNAKVFEGYEEND